MAVKILTKDNFDDTIQNHDLVVVDFFAKWCAPCRVFGDIIEAMSEAHPEVLFAKVNIEEEPELSEDFDVKAIPLLMVFKGNIAVFKESGAMTKEALLDLINQAKNLDVSEIKQWILEKANQK